jgi:nicotinamide-nucleotide amidase
MIDSGVRAAAQRVVEACIARELTVATAESCTGGQVAGALTDIPGSSAVLGYGFVTYSNAAKQKVLGVPAETLRQYGAVSSQTAAAMVQGALQKSGADIAVAITGIAGPTGGSAEKPVGLVQFAAAARDGRSLNNEQHFGDIGRGAVRRASVLLALAMLEELAGGARVIKPR